MSEHRIGTGLSRSNVAESAVVMLATGERILVDPATCQRLPPEIGVGDEVSWDYGRRQGDVVHVSGEWAWVHAPMYEAIHALSDLTLVKKAEKG